MNKDERERMRESIIHGLRIRGWSKAEAEAEAAWRFPAPRKDIAE